MAKTGSEIGSPIYINRDLIYTEQVGRWSALTVLECIPILVHELGHHQGEAPHTVLDLLGVKVQTLLSKNYSVAEFDPNLTVNSEDLSTLKEFPVATVLELSTNTAKRFDSRLYMSDSFGTYEITQNLMAGIQSVGYLEGQGAKRLAGSSCWGSSFEASEHQGWKFSQFHAGAARWTYASTIRAGELYMFYLKMALSIECVDRSGSRMVDPGLDVLQLVIVENERGKSRFKFIDAPELRSSLTLINDDDDYKVSAVTQAILKARK
ncbi:MAG: hypothetical protein NTV34_06360 [Proteobacteria bacterium]|nr:hypothetical protein [Pseudomonadota bacterium]